MEAELKAGFLPTPTTAEPELKPWDLPRAYCCLEIMAGERRASSELSEESKRDQDSECRSPSLGLLYVLEQQGLVAGA